MILQGYGTKVCIKNKKRKTPSYQSPLNQTTPEVGAQHTILEDILSRIQSLPGDEGKQA